MTPVAYEIVPGYRRPVIRLAGPDAPQRAARVWDRCATAHGASFRVIDATGQEFGTRRPGDIHGLGGIVTERCYDCGQEFRAVQVGDPLCPGCELVATGGVEGTL